MAGKDSGSPEERRTASPGAERPRTRRLQRGLVYGVLLVLLVGSVYPALGSLLQQLLGYAAGQLLSQVLDGTVEVGRVRGSLFGTLIFHDVVVRDRHGEVVAQVDVVRAAYDLAALLKKRLVVHEVEVVRPRLRLVQAPDGGWNLARLVPSDTRSAPRPSPGGIDPPPAIVVEGLHIRDGAIALQTPALPGVQRLEALQFHGRGQLQAQEASVQVHDLMARALPAAVDLRTVSGALRWRAGTLHIEHVHLATEHTRLQAAGDVSAGSHATDLQVHLQPLAVTDIGRLIQDEALQGVLQGTLSLQGPRDAVRVRGHVHLAEGRLDLDGEVNTAGTPWRYRSTLQATRVNLARLFTRPHWQSDLNGQLHLAGEGGSPQTWRGTAHLDMAPSQLGRIAIQRSQLQVEVQARRVQVQRFDLVTSAGHLTVAGTLDVAGDSALQYDVTMNLAAWQSLLPVETLHGTIRAQGQVRGAASALSLDGTFEAHDLRSQGYGVQRLQLTYTGTDLVTRPHIALQLLAREAQAGGVPVAQIDLATTYDGLTHQAQFTAEVVQSAVASGTARGAITLHEARRRLVIEDLWLRFADHPWHLALPLEVGFGKDYLHLKPCRLVHADETLEIAGGWDEQQRLDVRLEATQLDLSFVRRLLALPGAVQGRAMVQARLTGTFTDPHWSAAATVRAEPAPHMPATQAAATAVYAERQVSGAVRLHQAEREVVTLEARLPVDMALHAMPLEQRLLTTPVALHLVFRQPDLGDLQRWQEGFPRLAGRLEGTVDVRGPYTALTLEAALQLQQLAVPGVVTQVSGPLHLSATLIPAGTVAALAQGWPGRLQPQVHGVVVRIPAMRGNLMALDHTASPLQVRDVVLQANGHWTPQGPYGTLERLAMHVSTPQWRSIEFLGTAHLMPQKWELTHLRVCLPQSELLGAGSITLPQQHLQFHLELPRLRLDEFPLAWPPTLPQVVRGAVDVRGSVAAPRIEARLQYAEAQIAADLTAHVQEVLPHYSATVRIDGLDMARLLPGEKGVLHARLQVQGQGLALAQRRAQMTLSLEAPEVSLAPGLTARLQASLVGNTWRLEEMRLRSTPLILAVNGTASATGATALTYKLTVDDLAPLHKTLGLPVQARGELSGTARGPWHNLRTQGTLRLHEWRHGTWSGKGVQATFTAADLLGTPRASFSARLADLQGATFPPSSVQLEGLYTPGQGAVTLVVTSGPFRKTRLDGRVELGETRRVVLSRLRLQRHKLAWENVKPMTVVHDPGGAWVVQPFLLRSGAQEISGQGQVRSDGTLVASVQLQRVQLQPMLQAVMPEAPAPDGQLTLTLTVGGTSQQPKLTGEVHLTALQWGKRPLGEIQGRLGLTGTTLEVDMGWREQRRDLLQARGTVGLQKDGALALRVAASEVDLTILQALVPGVVQSAGLLSLDLRVQGDVRQPQAYGHLAVRDGSAQLVATGERYQDIEVVLVFMGSRVDITRCHIGSRSGSIQVTGMAESTGATRSQLALEVQAQQFTAIATPALEVVVSTDLSVRGTPQAMRATGTITVPRARVQLTGQLAGGPTAVQPWQLTVEGVYGAGPGRDTQHGSVLEPSSAQSLPFLEANLTIDLPRNVWIQGPGTSMEMQGTLYVTKAMQEPFVLSGTVETVRGFASFHGKKFALEAGRVTFTGTPDFNPMLDVTVTREVADHVVAVHVAGGAQRPQLSLSSTPELSQADIVSLLVIGKTSDRLTTSEQNALAGQAQQLVGNAAAREVESILARPLGLDTLDVEASEKLGTGKVSIGRYVTPDLFLSYERRVGEGSGNKVGVEYSVNRHVKLKGSSSDIGESALDVLWRFDY